MTVTFRPMTPDDRVFVVSNWVASFRTAHAAGLVPMRAYREQMWSNVGWCLDKEAVQTLVAEEDGALYGFLTFEPPAPRADWRFTVEGATNLDSLPYVYYAYTKEFRRRGRKPFGIGIMTGLLEAAGIDVTKQFGYACKTTSVIKLADAFKIPGARWDPLRARYEREQPR